MDKEDNRIKIERISNLDKKNFPFLIDLNKKPETTKAIAIIKKFIPIDVLVKRTAARNPKVKAVINAT
jgi:hypothetical protein